MSDYKYRDKRIGNGRIILRKRGSRESISARNNWQLWKLALTLNLDEIEFLITKRKRELKYEKNYDKVRLLRTEIMILEDAHLVIRMDKIKRKYDNKRKK